MRSAIASAQTTRLKSFLAAADIHATLNCNQLFSRQFRNRTQNDADTPVQDLPQNVWPTCRMFQLHQHASTTASCLVTAAITTFLQPRPLHLHPVPLLVTSTATTLTLDPAAVPCDANPNLNKPLRPCSGPLRPANPLLNRPLRPGCRFAPVAYDPQIPM